MNVKEIKLGIIGLGYVGLPLAAEFGKHRPVVAYDINQKRVDELSDGIDTTFELTSDELIQSSNLVFTSDINEIANLNCYIVTVPTPIDSNNVPDLEPLKSATESIARIISKGDIVIYESTVYPGATEEICVPIL
jgi:UDP-N-acetyl-D-galactosamine dehydrogenase